MEDDQSQTLTSQQTGLNLFYWGGTLSAIFLLILNRVKWRSLQKASLLVAYIFSTVPPGLFNILRGQFGMWVSFLAVAGHLFFPRKIPVSCFPLFVVAPSIVAHALRNALVGAVFCLIIGFLLIIDYSRGIRADGHCIEDAVDIFFLIGIPFLFFFPLMYFGLGSL